MFWNSPRQPFGQGFPAEPFGCLFVSYGQHHCLTELSYSRKSNLRHFKKQLYLRCVCFFYSAGRKRCKYCCHSRPELILHLQDRREFDNTSDLSLQSSVFAFGSVSFNRRLSTPHRSVSSRQLKMARNRELFNGLDDHRGHESTIACPRQYNTFPFP